ncbi:MAG TPA: prepilin-type N-terminal cleavage/methylation domain-containing protein [Longimicrobiales bacterium]|nr:prepilin-type N-terminal cleavage/methylation domain-containing protein [Longimicrobiales bacterium]
MRMRPGLSLVELLVVVLIIASIAGVVIPSYQRIVVKARAAEALSQIHAVRLAAYAYNTDTNGWPPDYAPGERPVELEPYLGPGYPFGGDGYLLDWENWVLADGTPKHPETGVLLGISMTTTNAALGQALVDLLGESTAHYTLGYNYTFVLAAI